VEQNISGPDSLFVKAEALPFKEIGNKAKWERLCGNLGKARTPVPSMKEGKSKQLLI
jgi:hypothetical protein